MIIFFLFFIQILNAGCLSSKEAFEETTEETMSSTTNTNSLDSYVFPVEISKEMKTLEEALKIYDSKSFDALQKQVYSLQKGETGEISTINQFNLELNLENLFKKLSTTEYENLKNTDPIFQGILECIKDFLQKELNFIYENIIIDGDKIQFTKKSEKLKIEYKGISYQVQYVKFSDNLATVLINGIYFKLEKQQNSNLVSYPPFLKDYKQIIQEIERFIF